MGASWRRLRHDAGFRKTKACNQTPRQPGYKSARGKPVRGVKAKRAWFGPCSGSFIRGGAPDGVSVFLLLRRRQETAGPGSDEATEENGGHSQHRDGRRGTSPSCYPSVSSSLSKSHRKRLAKRPCLECGGAGKYQKEHGPSGAGLARHVREPTASRAVSACPLCLFMRGDHERRTPCHPPREELS